MISLRLADKTITTEKNAFVMGIVNATPDSFWAGSRGGTQMALEQIEQGADIIDLGAESTRPGSHYVSEDEQIKRLIPVLSEIRRHSDIPVSIDTRKYSVMKACLDEGADILNDVSALEDDEKLAGLCAESKIPVILMHKRSTPDVMQNNTEYQDIFKEVDLYLRQRVEHALKQGISSDKIIVDPGIGFGKNFQANRILVTECGKLCGGKYPVVMGVSRKSFVAQITGRNPPPEDRLAGTLATNMVAVMAGASILRVHDVAATRDMLLVLENLKSERIGSIS